jgi:deoxyribodipyrimidine photo-lyase
VFDDLRRTFAFDRLLSHEETGPGWSYTRDLRVAAWCRARGVAWQEWPQTGVVRRLKDRRGWAGRWQARMSAPQVGVPTGWCGASGVRLDDLPDLATLLGDVAPTHLPCLPCQPLQPLPPQDAAATLADFLAGRGRRYRADLSSPLTAESGCSRLSAALAFGSLSMRQVAQATEARIGELKGIGDAGFAHQLRGFAGRLHWHCHFMQKLEDEPVIEFRNFARACDGLRDESAVDAARLQAWASGQTGFPMVDACMRQLAATGWLNFRMRAMLVSFAAYQLWLHWRAPGLHLARQFLDFEPGIHWSQMQMQSGTTGINTLRIYSPTKQALDHDPEGSYRRRWLPELARVPLARLATPWLMSPAEQREAGCMIGRDYPAPIVDEATALKQARDQLYALRRTPEARAEADVVQQRHGSRKSGLAASGQRSGAGQVGQSKKVARARPASAAALSPAAPIQGDLFGDPA